MQIFAVNYKRGLIEVSLTSHTWVIKLKNCFHSLCCCCCCQVAPVVSDSVWPHRWQPTRLPHPRDSPGKNTGVGCHFLLQCMKVKSESEVAQLCPTLSDSMDCSLPGSSVHGMFQARVLECGTIAFSPFPLRGQKRGMTLNWIREDKASKAHS